MNSQKSNAATLEALCQQALELHRSGRLEEARALYKKILLRNPRRFDTLHLFGTLCLQTGQAELAVAMLARAVAVEPRAGTVHNLLGAALDAAGRPDAALTSVEKAVALQPDLVEAHYNRAGLLQKLRRSADALSSYDQTVELQPTLAEAWYNRGLVLNGFGRTIEALESFEKAVSLKSDFVEAVYGCGLALQHLDHREDALAALDRTVILEPDHAEAHYARGLVLHELNRLDEAVASFDRAISLRPGESRMRFGRGLSLLSAGRFEAGWRDYEFRWGRNRVALDDTRRWRGAENLRDKTLFLYNEQGLGDTIQLARYVDLLRAENARVILSVQNSLAPLLQQLSPAEPLLSEGETPASFDFHCPLLSLPLAFGTTRESIPTKPAYLRASAPRRERFETLLGPASRPRVGLAWRGNPGQQNDRNRSMPFERLAPLLSGEVEWFCLQNEIRAADADAFEACGAARFLGEQLKDFGDTAALLDLMDLVITVDTSIAHLAGAMGKPVWIMLTYAPDWRWMLNRSDSSWYPSARLFRQTRIGDWDGVVEEVRHELRSLAP